MSATRVAVLRFPGTLDHERAEPTPPEPVMVTGSICAAVYAPVA